MQNSKSSFMKTPFFRLIRQNEVRRLLLQVLQDSRNMHGYFHPTQTCGNNLWFCLSPPLAMYVVINNKYKLNFTISVRTVIMKCSQPKMTNHIADDFIILPTPFVVEVCVRGGGVGCSETNHCHSLLVIMKLTIRVITIIISVITTVIFSIIIQTKWEEEAAPLDSSDYNF